MVFGPDMPKKGRNVKREPSDDYDPPSPRSGHRQPDASPPRSMPTPPLKLPDFWVTSPAAWFVHVESLFALHGLVDDDRQYHYVVAALPSSVASRLVGLLTRPPAYDKYDALKTHLLYSFTLSEAERADKLFSLGGLGSRRPSELMEHMLGLLGGASPVSCLSTCFCASCRPR